MKSKQAKSILKQVEAHYDEIADEFSGTRQNAWYEFEIYKELVAEKMRVLDIGCGNGRLYWQALKNRNIKYYGVDVSKNLLKEAKRVKADLKQSTEKRKVQFKHGKMQKLPFKAREFDRLFCVAAFHHLPTLELRQKTLQEFRRVLDNDGIAVVSVWNLFQKRFRKYIWQAIWRALKTKFAYKWNDTLFEWKGGKKKRSSKLTRYYHAFTPWEMRALLRDSGFEIVNELYVTQKSSVKFWWQSANLVWIIRKI